MFFHLRTLSPYSPVPVYSPILFTSTLRGLRQARGNPRARAGDAALPRVRGDAPAAHAVDVRGEHRRTAIVWRDCAGGLRPLRRPAGARRLLDELSCRARRPHQCLVPGASCWVRCLVLSARCGTGHSARGTAPGTEHRALGTALRMTGRVDARIPPPALTRAIGRWGYTAAIINSVIGSSVFAMPAVLARLVGEWSPSR